MQAIVYSFNCTLKNRICTLEIIITQDTDNIIKFLDMLLDEIIDLTVERLIAVCVRLMISTLFTDRKIYQLEFSKLEKSRIHAGLVDL